jgi:hypothetical protein
MKIEKRSYSRKPWRLVNEEGLEIVIPRKFEHPSLGWTIHSEPVCGDTKSEIIENVLAILETVLKNKAEKP